MGLVQIAEEFAQQVDAASSPDELAALLDAAARAMDFRFFALTHHVDLPRAPQPAVRLHNYPLGWVDYFDEHRLGPCDPVHRASHLTSVGFRWTRLAAMLDLTTRDRDILHGARRAGIGDGFTVPAHVPGESAGSCSFATADGRPVREEWLPLAQLVGAIAFEGARRLWGLRELGPDQRPKLTDRQRDCLYWAARGKSDWEIARILGISHDTVIQHLKQARERYGVGKRTQLLVHALFDGTLTFVDVLRR
ncbi:LuxR family transcriptional regulator [Sphingosinicella sp. LHD-64]|uniref:helix-turn-helix transcriptional regulator n=1 Tax=Sphingosinicella sp. LHD-64 TaxID=3072139 RepID=UPI00280E421C|nr:LuxR family transcriptional regulator [Sphingosinicella sp. LHD-64]MDQ8757462.1 LuxR family transcriptional regulator [Sphingosinicella sp. LHD-64]